MRRVALKKLITYSKRKLYFIKCYSNYFCFLIFSNTEKQKHTQFLSFPICQKKFKSFITFSY